MSWNVGGGVGRTPKNTCSNGLAGPHLMAPASEDVSDGSSKGGAAPADMETFSVGQVGRASWTCELWRTSVAKTEFSSDQIGAFWTLAVLMRYFPQPARSLDCPEKLQIGGIAQVAPFGIYPWPSRSNFVLQVPRPHCMPPTSAWVVPGRTHIVTWWFSMAMASYHCQYHKMTTKMSSLQA